MTVPLLRFSQFICLMRIEFMFQTQFIASPAVESMFANSRGQMANQSMLTFFGDVHVYFIVTNDKSLRVHWPKHMGQIKMT